MRYEDIKDKSELSKDLFFILDEGKTKKITPIYGSGYKLDDVVAMVFKDDITAGDGNEHDIITGKARIDWETNKNIFEYLNKRGLDTHYLCSLEEGVSVVKKLDKKINLEVVTRRVATGSILKHTNYFEGEVFRPFRMQFYYKDDFLHDPLLDESFLKHIRRNKDFFLFRQMMGVNASVFCALEEAFANFRLQLVDLKLEYGLINGKVVLIDEITASHFRLWPYADGVDKINLLEPNVLNQLNPEGRLDKDLYRKDEASFNEIVSRFQLVADITSKFKERG